MPGEDLPTAATAAIGGDDAPYEVEVVVDFGVAAVEYPTLTASTIGAHNAATGRTNSTNAASTALPVAPVAASPPQSQPKADPGTTDVVVDTVFSRSSLIFALSCVQFAGASDKKVQGKGVSAEQSKSAPSEQESDRMSEASENWAEDRDVPETAEEKQAKEDALSGEYEDAHSQVDPNEVSNRSITTPSGKRSSARASFYNDLKAGLETSKNSIRSSLEFIGTQIQTAKEMYIQRVQQRAGGGLEPREVYPRMPWHDVQASVSGLVARDIASHFIQVRHYFQLIIYYPLFTIAYV
jgi:hypothetical protein